MTVIYFLHLWFLYSSMHSLSKKRKLSFGKILALSQQNFVAQLDSQFKNHTTKMALEEMAYIEKQVEKLSSTSRVLEKNKSRFLIFG